MLCSPLAKLPLGSVRPRGWLRHQLNLMTEGMVGRLHELSAFLADDSSWLNPNNTNGTEEVPYWLRGFYPLAALTENQSLRAQANKWIEAVLASQDDSGYFGPRQLDVTGEFQTKFSGMFVHAVMLDSIVQHYELTGDERVIPFMTRFMKYAAGLSEEEFVPHGYTVEMRRPCEPMEHVHWLYAHTGQRDLLDLAGRFFRRSRHATDPWPGRKAMLAAEDNDMARRFRTDEWLAYHVVDFTHQYRYPGMFYAQSKQRWHLDATEYWYNQHLGTWGQPRGIFGADEVIRSTYADPRQGCETCAMVEFNKGFYHLGRLTGDLRYADRVEDIMLNHFPASQTADLKALHYLTASNQPQLDAALHDHANKVRMFDYSPHMYRCCQHNVAMGWPWYVQNLWQATADGGLAAWMYGPSEVTACVGEVGSRVRILEETNYPFRGQVRLTVQGQTSVAFPLYLRVPGWCRDFAIRLNGKSLDVETRPQSYVRIHRGWVAGDVVEIDMAMSISLTQWPRNGSVTVDRGPLSYSVRIEEQWRRCGGTDNWQEWEVYPTSPWNYGLEIDRDKPADSLTVQEKDIEGQQPWTIQNAPIEILAKARRIPAWQLDGNDVQELRPSPVRSDEPAETIRLIPLGCARLRMSCLPVIGDGPDARTWQ